MKKLNTKTIIKFPVLKTEFLRHTLFYQQSIHKTKCLKLSILHNVLVHHLMRIVLVCTSRVLHMILLLWAVTVTAWTPWEKVSTTTRGLIYIYICFNNWTYISVLEKKRKLFWFLYVVVCNNSKLIEGLLNTFKFYQTRLW